MALSQISGVPVTVYSADGAVDGKRSAAIAAQIAQAGVKNVIAAGNTGEYFSLSADEIRTLHAAVPEAVDGKALVTAAVGRALVEAKASARAAIADGAGAIMVHWPTDPFAGPADKIDYFLDIAEHATVPVVAYLRSDEPGLANMIRLAEHPNIAAIKYANANMMMLADVIRATRHCDTLWVCGLAEGWAPPMYALGAKGFTSGLVNVFPALSLRIFAALEAGDYAAARADIDEVVDFEKLRTLYNNGANVTVVKEALEILGQPAGPVRLPGVPRLKPDERKRLEDLVARIKGLAAAA
ncbi:dihydrodipicolinate synthase family protein [Acuticoccus sp. MNP-M23]|uniref:dihydrodipicolinate synthase family protein n=1 Tax=Acuticoccus sp. MNP-M23 TaxID=3072793 RepID=UPI00281577A3|nr:dihydrodipicolinate synthase family protein [Acuticoccus sp. MNP-M23]WMS42605.1 dihydrodipicolinate synthase family protein [Acuticoccus sp. MNP-M23]